MITAMEQSFFYAVFSSLLIPSIRTTSVNHNVDANNVPLKFEDIVDKKIYDKMRPPKPGGQPTKVEFHVTVMSLDSINEGSMTYAADIFFGQSWDDHRLKLPANMTSEYRLLPVEWLEEIWRPDSFFKNAKAVTFQRMTIPNHYLWLYRSKKIMYMVKLTLLLSCAMNFHKYPHDEQLCKMSMESLSHTTEDLVFEWLPEIDTPLVVDEGIELPQLELIQNFTADCTTNYSTGSFTCLEVVFRFKRRLGYFMFHTYIPTCLIVMMSWISFWIKPEAVPARVTLGVTSLLTLSTQHANSQKSLPPVSYIKAIDVFMSGCTVFVFLSLMEYALVNIVMGDIADIEKKKNSGLSHLLLGVRGPAMGATGGVKTQKSFHAMQDIGGMGAMGMSTHDPIDTKDHETENCIHSNFEDSAIRNFVPPAPRHNGRVPPGHNNGADVHHQPMGNHVFHRGSVPIAPPPPQYASGYTKPSVGLNTLGPIPGINKEMAQDAHAKKQKEIRDLMKKRREKAVLVDRISRWLFPTSFILLNIVYWALFGDHDLW